MRVYSSSEIQALEAIPLDDDLLIHADNALVLPKLAAGSFQLVYIDPPFNTGREQARTADRRRARRRASRRPHRVPAAAATARRSSEPSSYDDALRRLPRRSSSRGCARRTGSSGEDGTLYFHIDYREAHYCKVLLDEIFGRECFLNEIIWAYDYGARTKSRWPAKHDTILVYVKDPARVPLRLGGGRPRAVHGAGARHPGEGRTRASSRPTSGGTRSCRRTGREKTGYPTQKPEGILRRIVTASSEPGDLVPRLLRGLRHIRRGRREARPALRARRREPRRDRDVPPPAGASRPRPARRLAVGNEGPGKRSSSPALEDRALRGRCRLR